MAGRCVDVVWQCVSNGGVAGSAERTMHVYHAHHCALPTAINLGRFRVTMSGDLRAIFHGRRKRRCRPATAEVNGKRFCQVGRSRGIGAWQQTRNIACGTRSFAPRHRVMRYSRRQGACLRCRAPMSRALPPCLRRRCG